MWLQLGQHWLNMDRACVVQDDATSTPPGITVVFADGMHRTYGEEERWKLLQWLQWPQTTQSIRLLHENEE